MLGKTFKYYFINIWHFFTLLGFIAFGILLASVIFVPQAVTVVKNTGQDIFNIFKGIRPDDAKQIFSVFQSRVRDIDWSNPLEALQKIFGTTWVLDTFKEVINDFKIEGEAVLPQVTATLNSAGASALTILKNWAICIGISALVGYVVISILIHIRASESFNLLRVILSMVLNTIVIGGLLYLLGYLMLYGNQILLYAIAVAAGILSVFIYLFIAWFCYAGKFKIKLSEVMQVKNIFGLLIANLIMIGLSIGIVVLIYYKVNDLASVLLAVPLFVITFLLVDSSAINFVKGVSEEKMKNQTSGQTN